MTGLVAWIAIGGLLVFVILPALWAILLTPRRREERELERRYCQEHMTPQRHHQLNRWFEQETTSSWADAMNALLDVESAYRNGRITKGEFVAESYRLIHEHKDVWK